MSSTEMHTGTLVSISISEKYDTWKSQVEYLISQGHFFSDLDLEFEDYYVKKSTCFYYPPTETWYALNNAEMDDDADILSVSEVDGKLHYQLKYYNGGCGFDEALNLAIDKYFKEKR